MASFKHRETKQTELNVPCCNMGLKTALVGKDSSLRNEISLQKDFTIRVDSSLQNLETM